MDKASIFVLTSICFVVLIGLFLIYNIKKKNNEEKLNNLKTNNLRKDFYKKYNREVTKKDLYLAKENTNSSNINDLLTWLLISDWFDNNSSIVGETINKSNEYFEFINSFDVDFFENDRIETSNNENTSSYENIESNNEDNEKTISSSYDDYNKNSYKEDDNKIFVSSYDDYNKKSYKDDDKIVSSYDDYNKNSYKEDDNDRGGSDNGNDSSSDD